jgi:hypothetical protein
MARPIKQGLSYFPFDVDFFSDEKMVVINGEFGLKGEITTIKLLCAVYRNGYFIEWNDMLKYKLLKELPGVSAELLEQIIQRLVKWDFFDKGLFLSASILTSRGIQRRYQEISLKMRRKCVFSDYCLLNQQSVSTSQRTEQRKPLPPKVVLPASDIPPAPTVHKKPTLGALIDKMLGDSQWSEPVCMRYNMTSEQFSEEIADFKQHCLCLDKQPESLTDAKRYFCSWLSKKKYSGNSTKTTTATPTEPTDYHFTGFGSNDN